MSILEETILDKIRQLAPDQQQQVLAFVQSLQPAEFDYAAWAADVDQFQAKLREKYGDNILFHE